MSSRIIEPSVYGDFLLTETKHCAGTDTSVIGSSHKADNFEVVCLLHADINKDREQPAESTEIVPTYKEQRKS